MAGMITVTGMVLTASPIKEYDRRVELLTREIGRISAFVPGARKPGSPLAAAAIPFTFGIYRLYQGRSSYNVHSVEIDTYFDAIAGDFDAMCYASYFAEMVRHFTRENVQASEELKLLYITCKAVTHQQMSWKLMRTIFEMRLMQVEGEALELFRCVRCGEEQEHPGILLSQGGIVCSHCLATDRQLQAKTAGEKVWQLSPDALYTLQIILTRELGRLYSFRVSEAVEEELAEFMRAYLHRYIGTEFKSLQFINL